MPANEITEVEIDRAEMERAWREMVKTYYDSKQPFDTSKYQSLVPTNMVSDNEKIENLKTFEDIKGLKEFVDTLYKEYNLIIATLRIYDYPVKRQKKTFKKLSRSIRRPNLPPFPYSDEPIIDKIDYEDEMVLYSDKHNYFIRWVRNKKNEIHVVLKSMNKNRSQYELLDKGSHQRLERAMKNSTNAGLYKLMEKLCKVRIKSSKESSKLYGYSNVKSKMVSNNKYDLYDIKKILLNHTCEDGVKRIVYEIHNPSINKNIKFIEDDLELVFIPFENVIKCFKPSIINKELDKHDKVLLINNKGTNLPKKSILTFMRYENIGSKSYALLFHNGKRYRINNKNFKKIHNNEESINKSNKQEYGPSEESKDWFNFV